MLNELLILERGVRQAGFKTVSLHPDVKDAGRKPTILVRLNSVGQVSCVRLVIKTKSKWTLRDGQQNSFPFIQLMPPLLKPLPDGDASRNRAWDRKDSGRRLALLEAARNAPFNADALQAWPGAGFLRRLAERRAELAALGGTEAAVVLDSIDRFLLACPSPKNAGGGGLLEAVNAQVLNELCSTAEDDFLEAAAGLLLGKFDKPTGRWLSLSALLFDGDRTDASIIDERIAEDVSNVLNHAVTRQDGGTPGVCALSGLRTVLLSSNSPQPSLPELGQTYLFSKNKDIPANDRYGRFATEAMSIGQDTIVRLGGALRALTSDDREGVTWRTVPAESSKQRDLLLAFVGAAPGEPFVGAVYAPEEDDLSEESDTGVQSQASSVAAYEARTQRLIEAVQARVGLDFRTTPVTLAVLRKVDQANRKIVYASAPSVGTLHDAAKAWVEGERNVPDWLALPVFRKGERTPIAMSPPHVAPLGVIAFSKTLFIRNGTGQQQVSGIPAAEALGLFLDADRRDSPMALHRARRVLGLTLSHRSALLLGVAHSLRSRSNRLDRREALRTVTLLAVLLHKLGRTKEVYVNEIPFKLGQLLAAADAVHAGYCADVRGGALPPSLLGNQVFGMAQTAPAKALATLCRRWKPYDGWAKKAGRERDRVDRLIASPKSDEQQRGWDIKKALRGAREAASLADSLRDSLAECKVDDTFRAELLLGYVAGIPKSRATQDDEHELAANARTE